MRVDRRRRLTPRNRRESTCYHADQRPICALNNTREELRAVVSDTASAQGIAKGATITNYRDRKDRY